MFKKYKWLIILLVVIVLLIAVSLIFSEDDEKYIHDISLSEVSSKIKNGDSFILYIKQTDCEHCKAFTPNFIAALSESNLEAYSLNISDLSDEDNEKYEEMFDVDGTPTVLFFDNGNESLIRIEGEQTKARIKSKFESVGFLKETSK